MERYDLMDGVEFLNGCTKEELEATMESEQEVLEEKQRVIDGCRRRLAKLS